MEIDWEAEAEQVARRVIAVMVADPAVDDVRRHRWRVEAVKAVTAELYRCGMPGDEVLGPGRIERIVHEVIDGRADH